MAAAAKGNWVTPSIEMRLMISGGFLGPRKSLDLPHTDVNGSIFIEPAKYNRSDKKCNRDLAKLLGLPTSVGSPFKDFWGFAYLKQQRTKVVDELIVQHMLSQDETADATPSKVDPKVRASLFEAAGVPVKLKIDLPELASSDGKSHVLAPCSFWMLSTPRRDENVQVELTSADGSIDIFSWLRAARYVELDVADDKVWGNAAWGTTAIEESLPELPPNYSYKKKRDGIHVSKWEPNSQKSIMKKLGAIECLTPEIIECTLPLVIDQIQKQVLEIENSSESKSMPEESSTSETPTKAFPIFSTPLKRKCVDDPDI